MFQGFGGTTAAFYGLNISPKYWEKNVLLILCNNQKIQKKMQRQKPVSKI
jgi:hypothetical protein